MQAPVEIRYAGVVVARAEEVTPREGGLFLAVAEPLPVGTVIGLGADDARGLVEQVVESADPKQAGMRVRPLQPGEEISAAREGPEDDDADADEDTVSEPSQGSDDLPRAKPLPAPDGRRRRAKRRR